MQTRCPNLVEVRSKNFVQLGENLVKTITVVHFQNRLQMSRGTEQVAPGPGTKTLQKIFQPKINTPHIIYCVAYFFGKYFNWKCLRAQFWNWVLIYFKKLRMWYPVPGRKLSDKFSPKRSVINWGKIISQKIQQLGFEIRFEFVLRNWVFSS